LDDQSVARLAVPFPEFVRELAVRPGRQRLTQPVELLFTERPGHQISVELVEFLGVNIELHVRQSQV
jgi:hypothetical protein